MENPQVGPEIRHPYHWNVRLDVLCGEVLVCHSRVRRATTVDTRPTSGIDNASGQETSAVVSYTHAGPCYTVLTRAMAARHENPT